MSTDVQNPLDVYVNEMIYTAVVTEALQHRQKIHQLELQLLYIKILWREAAPAQKRRFRKELRDMKIELKRKIRKLKRELP